MDVLWITQMDKDGQNDHEVITLQGEGAWRRVLKLPIIRQRDKWLPYDVIITLKNENGDLVDVDPVVIEAVSAEWLLSTFYNQPKKYWRGLKQVVR